MTKKLPELITKGMSERYNLATNKLFEKLIKERESISSIKLVSVSPSRFLYDQMIETCPHLESLVKEVEQENNYELSINQIDFALSVFRGYNDEPAEI